MEKSSLNTEPQSTPLKNNSINAHRISFIIIALIGMIGTFLPWASNNFSVTFDGTHGDGWATFALFFTALLCSLYGDRTSRLKSASFTTILIVCSLAGAIGVFNIYNIHTIFNADPDNKFLSEISIGPGLYVIVIASVCSLLVRLIIKQKN